MNEPLSFSIILVLGGIAATALAPIWLGICIIAKDVFGREE